LQCATSTPYSLLRKDMNEIDLQTIIHGGAGQNITIVNIKLLMWKYILYSLSHNNLTQNTDQRLLIKQQFVQQKYKNIFTFE